MFRLHVVLFSLLSLEKVPELGEQEQFGVCSVSSGYLMEQILFRWAQHTRQNCLPHIAESLPAQL